MIETIAYQDSNGNKPYADWLKSLADKQAKARILVRVNRIAAGNFGDCKPCATACKSDQNRAIKQAVDYLNDWKERANHECTTTRKPR
jgi:putative component of toxin-antitoxin plasmid stabilization module